MQAATEKCPWCGSPIPRARFEEITAKIREEEQKKLKETEKKLKEQAAKDLKKQLTTSGRFSNVTITRKS